MSSSTPKKGTSDKDDDGSTAESCVENRDSVVGPPPLVSASVVTEDVAPREQQQQQQPNTSRGNLAYDKQSLSASATERLAMVEAMIPDDKAEDRAYRVQQQPTPARGKPPSQELSMPKSEKEGLTQSAVSRMDLVDHLFSDNAMNIQQQQLVKSDPAVYPTTNDNTQSPPPPQVRTSSGAVVAVPPPTLQRGPARPAATPGAFPVAGTNMTAFAMVPVDADNDDGGDDGEDANHMGTNQEDAETGASPPPNPLDPATTNTNDPLIEARLVPSTELRRSSNPRPSQAPFFVDAKPWEFSWKDALQSRKLWCSVLLLVVIALGIGLGVGVAGHEVVEGEEGEDSSDGGAIIVDTIVTTNAPTATPISTTDGLDDDNSGIFASSNLQLPESTVSAIQNDPTSPQFLANLWMMEDPNLDRYSNERQLQRFALATFFYATNAKSSTSTVTTTNVAQVQSRRHWTHVGAWLNHSVHECEWGMVTEFSRGTTTTLYFDSDETGDAGEQLQQVPQGACDANSTYRHLVLQDNTLLGTLPAELFWFLPHLETLDLSRNRRIHGSMSSELGLLHKLKRLNLGENNFFHSLPTELGTMSSLQELRIHSNILRMSLPTELGLLGATLTELQLKDNKLTNSLPTELGSLSRLLFLSLHDNLFTGSLFSELGRMTALTKLDLSINNIQHRIPVQIGRLAALQSLYLNDNQLSKLIPSEIGTLSSLELLHLDGNDGLTGSVPGQLCSLQLNGSLLVLRVDCDQVECCAE